MNDTENDGIKKAASSENQEEKRKKPEKRARKSQGQMIQETP